MHRLVFLVVALAVSSCGFKEYENVSADPAFLSQINRAYRLRDEAVIHAVTMDPNYKKSTALYVVMPKPGFDGPEVLSRSVLPAGTELRVIRVERCSNWWCNDVRFIVALPGYIDHPVALRSLSLVEPTNAT